MPVSVIKYLIKKLTKVTQDADIIDKIIELENAPGSASDKSYHVSVGDLAQTIHNHAPAPLKVTHVIARTYDDTDPFYAPGTETLVSETAKRKLAMWSTAYVEFPYPSKQYRLVYDPLGPHFGYTGTDFIGQPNHAKWVEIGSADDLARGITDFNPFQTKYATGDTVKYTLGGRLRIFSARVDLVKASFGSKRIPEPTGLSTDANWVEVNPDTENVPNQSRLGDVLCRFYSLAESQADPYGGAALDQVDENLLCIGRVGRVELGPNAGAYRVVYDPGTTPAFHAYTDGSFAGGKNPCKWELVAGGLSSAVIDWVPGPQQYNTFVNYGGAVWLVLHNLANGLDTPEDDPSNYQQFATIDQIYGLSNQLTKKADLVNGVVPASQLPPPAATPSNLVTTNTQQTITESKHFTGAVALRFYKTTYTHGIEFFPDDDRLTIKATSVGAEELLALSVLPGGSNLNGPWSITDHGSQYGKFPTYKSFADSTDEAIVRKDYLVAYVAANRGSTLSPDQVAALAGTKGTPSAANRYVTDADGRLLSADTAAYVVAQSDVFTRFAVSGSKPQGYSDIASVASAATQGDTLRYNRAYTETAGTINLNTIYLDGQQNAVQLLTGAAIKLNGSYIYDLEIYTAANATLTLAQNTFYQGGRIGDAIIPAGETVTLDSVRFVGILSGGGTVILQGTTATPSRTTGVTIVDKRATTYTLPIATSSVLGGVKLGKGLRASNATGTVQATGIDYVAEQVFDYNDGTVGYISRGRTTSLKDFPAINLLSDDTANSFEGSITAIRNVSVVQATTINVSNSGNTSSAYFLTLAPGEYVWLRSTATAATSYEVVVRGNIARLAYAGFTPQAIRTAVYNSGVFYQGEMTSAVPAGSTPGMKFSAGNGTANYVYEYMNPSTDADGTTFTWVRWLRG